MLDLDDFSFWVRSSKLCLKVWHIIDRFNGVRRRVDLRGPREKLKNLNKTGPVLNIYYHKFVVKLPIGQ